MTESDPFQTLTPRERRCLELVALHYDTAQIAEELGISATTVSGYLADARRKLGARNRKEAARMVAGALPATPTAPPPNLGGQFERVEAPAPSAPPRSPQPNVEAAGDALADSYADKGIAWSLMFDRPLQPHQFGPMARLGMIVVLVVALAAAMALAVIAVVGLVSISTSLRP